MSRIGETGGQRGAALVLALVVSAVVLLSTILLLGYIESLVSRQVGRELQAQARLSQRAAAEASAIDLEKGDVPAEGPIPPDELAGMRTTFAIEDYGSCDTRTVDLDLPSDGLRRLLPAHGFLAAYSRAGHLVLDHLAPSGARSEGFPLDLGREPAAWDIAGFSRGPYLAAVLEDRSEGRSLTLVFRDGTTSSMDAELLLWRQGGNLASGYYGGQPALMATSGRNWGHLVLLESQAAFYVHSPAGTSPAILQDGSLFGNLSREGTLNLPGPAVEDFYQSDVDGDGRADLVWITGNGVSCYLLGREVLLKDQFPGGESLAWGGIAPWSDLAVLWRDPQTGLRWRRLSWNGFVDMDITGSALERQWEGRITSGDGMLLGVADNGWILHMPDGSARELCPADEAVCADFDGSMGPEVVSPESGGLRAWMNPLSGAGSFLQVRAVTRDGRGTVHHVGRWRYTLFQSPEGVREVYLESLD